MYETKEEKNEAFRRDELVKWSIYVLKYLERERLNIYIWPNIHLLL